MELLGFPPVSISPDICTPEPISTLDPVLPLPVLPVPPKVAPLPVFPEPVPLVPPTPVPIVVPLPVLGDDELDGM